VLGTEYAETIIIIKREYSFPALLFHGRYCDNYRDVIHAQGARIRAQGAPGYAHKEQAYKQGGRLTGNFIPKRVILLPNPAVLERDLYLKLE
jgi:hypothetical protein